MHRRPAAVFDKLDMVSTPGSRHGSGRLRKKYSSDAEEDSEAQRRVRRRLVMELSETESEDIIQVESEDDVEPPPSTPPSLLTPDTDRSIRYRERYGSVAEGMPIEDEPIEGTQLYSVPRTPGRRRKFVRDESVEGSNAVTATSARDDPESDTDDEGSDESSERDDETENDALVGFDSPVARVAQAARVEAEEEEEEEEPGLILTTPQQLAEARPNAAPRSPIFLNTVFALKDFVKAHGADWDGDLRQWVWGEWDTSLERWCGHPEPLPDALRRFVPPLEFQKKIYLDNDFPDNAFVKSHGAKFDRSRSKWWVYDPVPRELQRFIRGGTANVTIW